MSKRGSRTALACVVALSAVLNLWNISFPLAFHADEQKKVYFIETGRQDFNHPLLLLQIGRLASAVLPQSDDQGVATIARSASALLAALACLFSFLLARRSMDPLPSLAVAAAVAVSPTLVMHAHYLKEDALLTTALLASIAAFLRFADRPGTMTAGVLGIAVGLAFSSHYKAVLLAPLLLAAPLLDRRGADARLWSLLALAGGVAACVFVLLNWPLLFDPQLFSAGVRAEANHAWQGHDIVVGWRDFWLTFHLRFSLAPGMRLPALVAGLAGLVVVALSRTRMSFTDRFLLVFVGTFYLVPEVSPLKPWPDFPRYVMPVVPVLLYFGWRGVQTLFVQPGRARSFVYAAMVSATIIWPAWASARMLSGIRTDTRFQAQRWLEEHPGRAIFERRGSLTPSSDVFNVTSLDPDDVYQGGVDYFVASSFAYGRFELARSLAGQTALSYDAAGRYTALFNRPYIEIRPDFETFAFSNPVIRIVRLGGEAGGRPQFAVTAEALVGRLEEPQDGAELGRELEIKGWAMSGAGVAEVIASVDGKEIARGPLNASRPEIAAASPGLSRGSTLHGWQWEASAPPKLAPGAHELVIETIDRQGNRARLAAATVIVRR